jgi:hypothetical protein
LSTFIDMPPKRIDTGTIRAQPSSVGIVEMMRAVGTRSTELDAVSTRLDV